MDAKAKRSLSINTKWCKGCGICVHYCPRKVLSIVHGKVSIIEPENCTKCGMCELMCPDYAIYIEEGKNNGQD